MHVKKENRLFLRTVMLVVGLYFMGLAMALFAKSDTGVSPMVALPLVLNQMFPAVSLGSFTIVLNCLFFIGQFVVNPRSFSWSKCLQAIPNISLGLAIDLNVLLLAGLELNSYIGRLLCMAGGCLLLAACIAIVVSANIIFMPIDAFIGEVALRTGLEWGNTKTILDVIMVAAAAGLSLGFLGYVSGVREGTLIAVVTVGQFVRFLRPVTDRLAGQAGCPIR